MRKTGFLFFVICLLIFAPLAAQEQKRMDRIKEKNISQQFIKSIKRKPEADTVFNYKSEEIFFPFKDKIIRSIQIERVGFERTVLDTARTLKNSFSKVANSLHTTSKEWVIRSNLFIDKKKPLNPYRLADNERYLRDLDFILDARIFVYLTAPESDSVDVLVVTRDLFGFGAAIDPSGINKYKFRIQNSNLFGMGQRLQYTGLVETTRAPILGQEIVYKKTNLLGTFIDGTLGFTQTNTGRSLINENESALFLRLNRPLFMPFARWAGGFELSRNYSENVYLKPVSEFASYTYDLQDAWIGYSFGSHHQQTEKYLEDRHRFFLSTRFMHQHFLEYPHAKFREVFPLLFNNRVTALSQITWFKQNFYKTKFIYGFERTEDVPYGYAASLTSGWEKQVNAKRLYTALQGTKTMANKGGNFISLDGKIASYWNDGASEDVLLSATISYFSKLYPMQKWGVRHFAEANYSQILNRTLKNPFNISNGNGIGGMIADSLVGDARVRARIQVIVFTPIKLAGFHFAVVPQMDVASLAKSEADFSGSWYQGYSVGIRTRNENLVFNTVELRAYYYPKTTLGIDPTKIEIRGNLRVKYPTSLINAPATLFGE